MELSGPMTGFHVIIWLTFFRLMLFSVSGDDPRISESGLFCGQTKPPPNTSYIPLFVKEMEMVSQQVNKNGWGRYSIINESHISIYALAQCYQDLSHTDCLLCYAASRTRLPRCLPAMSARVYLDGCFFRYDKYDFYNESIDPITDNFNCSSSNGIVSDDEVASFGKTVSEMVDKVSIEAVMNGGFAVKGGNGVYGLAQCWKTLSKESCIECLEKASRNVKQCVPSREGRGLNAGCYLKYSTHKFYNDNPQSYRPGTSKTGRLVAIVAGIGASILFCVFAICATHTRLKRYKQEQRNLGQISNLYKKSNLNFRYETLEKATEFFDPSRKIGQGGAGTVYKGILRDGKTVAVKRLSFNTRQWVDEFFNEVNLISKIQHKNLVKLLGCSIEGSESLLVYEFISNGSLDQYLTDKNVKKILNWKERFGIILGTAEAIAFLHGGGAEIRIIHRDIKSSNVLLDEKFEPKVADFGLVRCFGEDITHLTTGIAGTLGYMAPEYLVKGQLTEKADVFSFGILVFEIICGRRNTFFEGSGSLTQNVWKLYKMEKVSDSVDPRLSSNFPENEASKILKIGLLCTQASAALRPSMEEVVHMLKEKTFTIPVPNQPPFLNAGLLSTATTKSYTYSTKSSSSTSNTVNTRDISSNYDESSSTRSLDTSVS